MHINAMAEFINEGNPIKTNISWAFFGNPKRVPYALVLCSRHRVRQLNPCIQGKNDILANSSITPVDKKTKDPRLDTENAGWLSEGVCAEDRRLSVDTKRHSAGFGSKDEKSNEISQNGPCHSPATLYNIHSLLRLKGLTCMTQLYLPVGPRLGEDPELFNIEADSNL